MKFFIKPIIIFFFAVLVLIGCSTVRTSYRVTKKTVKGTIWTVKGAYELTAGTSRLIYTVGKFTGLNKMGRYFS